MSRRQCVRSERVLEVLSFASPIEIERRHIHGIDGEDVLMRAMARRRTWTAVSASTKAIDQRLAIGDREAVSGRRYVVGQPMCKGPARRIRVVHDQRKDARSGGRIGNLD